MPHILIIEDDPELGPLLKRNLELEGYRVSLAADGRLGLDMAMSGAAQLVILDLMLPLLDGMHLLKRLRRELISTPVLILSAKGTEADRLEGFRAGCDDYVTKPFSLMELIARVRAVLKRSGYRDKPSVIHSGGWIIDPHSRRVTKNRRTVDQINGRHELNLSPREFDLLYELASHPDQPLSRTCLLDEIWGEDADVTPRTVDTHIASLRHKLESNPDNPRRILTVYKVGYVWRSS